MSLIRVKPGWTRLEGIDNWKAEFKTLLEEANDAASQKDAAPRLKTAAYLAGFIQESFPQDYKMDQLDDLARKLAEDVLRATIEERLANIAARTTEYVQFEKSLDNSAEEAEEAAASARLTGITRLIETATETIKSARDLARSLNTGKATEKKVADLIEDTVATVEELRTAIARLV